MELTAEYDSQAADFFTQARAGTTRYFRIHCLSTVLAGAATVKYALQIDFAGKIFDDGWVRRRRRGESSELDSMPSTTPRPPSRTK